MKRPQLLTIIITVTVIGIGGLLFLSTDNQAKPDNTNEHMSSQTVKNEAKPGENEIFITDFAFKEPKLVIKKGTKVTWVNKDGAHHDITPLQESNDFRGSELLSKGETYSFTFMKTGTYEYKCSPHPYMKASVEVTE
jgi:plastocyanin